MIFAKNKPPKSLGGCSLLLHCVLNAVLFLGALCVKDCTQIIRGTIAAAAVINEIIAVIAAKKGFELAGEINSDKTADNPPS